MCKEGIKVDLAKIKAILDLKAHVNPRQVMVFLGYIGYYRKFIRHYSNITYPMKDISRVNPLFSWNKKCIEAFETLKKKLIKAPILRFSNWAKKFHVHINPCAIAILN